MAVYTGNDNYGKPKALYLEKINGMSNEDLQAECEKKMWLSAFANNNPRSDYHWMIDACYDECQGRNSLEIYDKAYKNITKNY